MKLLKKLKTLQTRRLLQGLIKQRQEPMVGSWQREIDLSCDISTFEKDYLKGFWDNFYDNHNLLL